MTEIPISQSVEKVPATLLSHERRSARIWPKSSIWPALCRVAASGSAAMRMAGAFSAFLGLKAFGAQFFSLKVFQA